MRSRLKIAQKLFAIILILAIATLAGLAYPLVPVTVTGTVTAATTNASNTVSLFNGLSLTTWVTSLVSLNTYSIPQTVCQNGNGPMKCEVIYSTTIAAFPYVATSVSASVFQQSTTLKVSKTSTTTFINYTSMNEPAYVTYGLNGIDFAVLAGVIIVLLVGVIILGAREKKAESEPLQNLQS